MEGTAAVTMSFDAPWMLALAAALPLGVALLLIASMRRRRRRLERLGTEEIVERLVPLAALRTPRTRLVLLVLAAALCATAVAGPRWGLEHTVIRGEGIDLVLALDASLSMLATDERPTRMARMKQEVRRLRALSTGDRIGLIAFAGRSYILSPLTIDDGALDLYLDNLDPSVVGQAGSSLARAIRQGVALLLATTTGSDRALVVMSDGEAFEPVEDVIAAARLASERGISLVTVGFGTAAGSTIPVRDGDRTTLKRDQDGEVVVTRYTPEMLRRAAEAANGVFIDAGETDKAARIRGALSHLRTQQRAAVAGSEQRLRFQLFLLPALLLLLADTVVAERRGRQKRRAAAATPAAPPMRAPARGGAPGTVAACLLVPTLLACGDASADAARAYRAGQYVRASALYRAAIGEGDQRPATVYNLGTSLLAADSLQAAAEPLERATRADEGEVRYRSLFNLGLAHLRRGLGETGEAANEPLDAALAAYKQVLLMRSDDLDAKWNYELALRKRQQGGGGGGGGGGGADAAPAPDPSPDSPPAPQPAGGLGSQRAEQLLNSAAREERDVQARRQRQARPDPPPGGRDW